MKEVNEMNEINSSLSIGSENRHIGPDLTLILYNLYRINKHTYVTKILNKVKIY